ncbi:MAG: polyphenol oxidase [Desulfobacteraceae bacterium Eth-SRB1]|nr:MAG: polyphenol oxidase [Desulfobacteraceae bacterium Eth-SRB1]
MILRQKKGVSFFQFPHIGKFANVRHGIFTRSGGWSRNAFQSLNVSFDVGDNHKNVEKNRRIISECIGGKDLVFLKQMHAATVLIFSSYDKPNGASGSPLIGDAMVTDIPNKYLVIQVADCQPVLMYDPVRHVVANIHSGWRGSINNVIGCTVNVMNKRFGCNSNNIIAGIGPSLGPCCAQFINYKKEIPDIFWQYRDSSDRFDFWSISLDQLCDAGVLIENIHISRICSKCNSNLFFSFRGEGTTGRFASVIGLK